MLRAQHTDTVMSHCCDAISSPLYLMVGKLRPSLRHSLSICPRELVNQSFLSISGFYPGKRQSWATSGALGLLLGVRAEEARQGTVLRLTPLPVLQQECPWGGEGEPHSPGPGPVPQVPLCDSTDLHGGDQA